MSGKPGARSSCSTVIVATPSLKEPVTDPGGGSTVTISSPFQARRDGPVASRTRTKFIPSLRTPLPRSGSSVPSGTAIASSGPSDERFRTEMRNVIKP